MRLDEKFSRWMTLIGSRRVVKQFVGIDLFVNDVHVLPVRRLIVVVVDIVVDIGIGVVEVRKWKIVGNFVDVLKTTSAHRTLRGEEEGVGGEEGKREREVGAVEGGEEKGEWEEEKREKSGRRPREKL